ncbi:MAG: phenylacetate-CoA oxygenase subunit PaaJ [bacterium]|nr:phenylacetate-CoA oxygenase subunit PaaJ [bacterium]
MIKIDNQIQEILESVSDPEIPVLSILDMGIVKDAQQKADHVLITITPTYSGCPAMDVIEEDIVNAFKSHNIEAKVDTVLSPPWTTEWISENGKQKLEKYGIAPPMNETMDKKALLDGERIIKCPQCGSTNTEMVSQFGSTPCKALFKCQDCLEPFDYLKCI